MSVKCNILGVVLNAVDASAPDYYYSYRYYPYSYGYGPQEAGEHVRTKMAKPSARACPAIETMIPRRYKEALCVT